MRRHPALQTYNSKLAEPPELARQSAAVRTVVAYMPNRSLTAQVLAGLVFTLGLCGGPPASAAAPAAIRVLLITGGCCHDYAAQKDILKKGLEARANLV